MSKITVEEQREMGLIRENYVPAQPPAIIETTGRVISDHQRVQLPQPVTDLSVTPTATAHIDMRTSAQDRAWGFLIASTPRTFVFALALTLIAIMTTGIGLIAAIVMLVSIFSVVELVSYGWTLMISAEGTAHYEARQKWQVIKREQAERWQHYKRLNGGE